MSKVKLDFTYDIENEARRVIYTLGKRDFYVEHGYAPKIPNGLTTRDMADVNKITKIIAKEMNHATVDLFINDIKIWWDEHQDTVLKGLEGLNCDIPTEINILITQYGVGGSYNPPQKIIMNIHNVHNPHNTLVHEFVHCIIEIPIINKLNIVHEDKERLVDYFLINNFSKLFPEYAYQRFGPPSRELLKKVGWK